MNRLFGNAKPAAPKATLSDANATMEKRGESLDTKIQKMDSELFRYTEQVCSSAVTGRPPGGQSGLTHIQHHIAQHTPPYLAPDKPPPFPAHQSTPLRPPVDLGVQQVLLARASRGGCLHLTGGGEANPKSHFKRIARRGSALPSALAPSGVSIFRQSSQPCTAFRWRAMDCSHTAATPCYYQLKKMKPGPAKASVQKRAMAILKQVRESYTILDCALTSL